MRLYLEALGCRLNAAEIEELARRFVGAGCCVTETPEAADVIVLNTCAVTAEAARKSRSRLRTLHRRNPQAQLAALGCWAATEAEAAQQLPGVAWVLSNADKAAAVAHITGRQAEPAPWSPGRFGHTRAFLAVQDGCDSACTYCLTRILRGPARSRPLVEVVAAARALAAQGAQEIVLTGVSLGAYGRDLGRTSGLAALVTALLQDTDIPRLRLSSIEPWDVDAALLRQWRNPRLCRQVHLPLQSGSDTVLRRMGRRITVAQFSAHVASAREIAPELALTTDVIVGFPGESAAEFAATLALVEVLACARLHVFPYSRREGTPAARLPEQLEPAVRAARAAELRTLGARLARAYQERFIGRTLPVLWERQGRDGRWRGLTDNYLEVALPTEKVLYNSIAPTRLAALVDGIFEGELQNA